MSEAYKLVLDDVMDEFDSQEDPESFYSKMLDNLIDLIEYDLSKNEKRLPSLMQSTVEEMEAEYQNSLQLYPKLSEFLDRIQALY